MSELKPRRARANAFDLNRTDRDDVEVTPPVAPLSELLPRVADRPGGTTTKTRPAPAPTPRRSERSGQPDAATTRTAPATSPTRGSGNSLDGPIRSLPGVDDDRAVVIAPAPAVSESPRGVGGRPTVGATGRITATAARVPVALYDRAEDMVKGRGKPSWGQLIAWTCKTRQQEVIAQVLTQMRPAEGLVPRGQNKRGTASTQITARFTPVEEQIFTLARERAEQAAAVSSAPLEGSVTATLVVIAALEVAAQAWQPTGPSVAPRPDKTSSARI